MKNTESLISELRSQTQVDHEALEGLLPLMDPNLRPDVYVKLLKKFYGFYQPLEARISAVSGWSELGFDLERRKKAPLAARDLRHLGHGDAVIALQTLCPESMLPTVDTMADAIGCLYVLEGSTLGGQVISRHLNKILGIDENTGAAFFRSYGADVGPFWREYLQMSESFGANLAKRSIITMAACNTFQKIRQWLTDEGAFAPIAEPSFLDRQSS